MYFDVLTNLIVLRSHQNLLTSFNIYFANDKFSRLENQFTDIPKTKCLSKETFFTTNVLCSSPPQFFVTTNTFVVMAASSQRTKKHKIYQNSDFLEHVH